MLRIYRKSFEATWGIVPTELSTVIPVISIDSIKLVNAKSGISSINCCGNRLLTS